jgi:D-alanyl-lipoteichoic acid acyltransferase DltB (MBOAT superfamily)
MLFPTFPFLVFFAVVGLACIRLERFPQGRKLFLVLASYVFYACWNWRFCFLLAGSSLWTYAAGRLLERTAGFSTRRWIVGLAVAGHLLLLGFFKYFDFFVGSLNQLAHALGLVHELPFIEVILPVGISFFTFHGISYVVDVYRGDVAVCRRLTDMLLYISFFPQLVAGPIVRASFFLPQLYRGMPARIEAAPALLMILGGLFKKVVIANYIATDLVDPVFFDPETFPTIDLLAAIYGYAVQIYCDFSAYSDIAIGIAALLGYYFPPNFNQPYRAQSFQDFWRRWHISLSSWLRDYLYKPLGGSRFGSWMTARNLALTMLLGGIWHGADWKFVIWGGLHGAALITERLLFPEARAGSFLRRALRTVFVFHFVCLCWIFFRAENFQAAGIYLGALAHLQPGVQQLTPFTLALVILGMSLHVWPQDFPQRLAQRMTVWPDWALSAAAGFGIVCITALGPDGVAPFIYFQF